MATSDANIKDIFSNYIKCDFDEEKSFIEGQKKAGIKVCDNIYFETDNENDRVKIVTQLSCHNEDNCIKPGPDKGSDHYGNAANECDYFISSMTVSADERYNNCITTVVGKKDSDLEVVYKANLEHKKGGAKLAYHSSHVRQRKLTKTLSLNTQRPDIVNVDSPQVPSQDPLSVKTNIKKKSSLKFSFKKNKSSTKVIDESAKDQVAPVSPQVVSSTTNDKVFKKPKELKPFLIMKSDVPFVSFKIGSSSEPFHSVLTRNKDRSKSMCKMEKKDKPLKTVSNKAGEKNDAKGTSFSTTIDYKNDRDIYKSLVNGPDERSSISESIFGDDEEQAPAADITALSDACIVMEPRIQKKLRTYSCPTVVCNCKDRKLKLITEAFNKLLDSEDLTDCRKQMLTYNHSTYHFSDCDYGNLDIDVCKSNCWRQSQNTLHDYCSKSSDNLDQPISPFLCQSMQDIVDGHDENIESNIELSEKDLQFFLTNRCYHHYARRVLKDLNSRFTPYHLSRLLHITRTIVRHIGNPKDKSSEQSIRIFQFLVQFYGEYFLPHIKEYHDGSFDQFLFTCECDNFEDVQ